MDTMVTVVDGPRFLRDFGSGEDLLDRGLGVDVEDDRSIAELLVDQVELANVLVLNKTDRMSGKEVCPVDRDPAQAQPDGDVGPRRRTGGIPLDLIFDTGLFDFERVEQTAGWLQETNRSPCVRGRQSCPRRVEGSERRMGHEIVPERIRMLGRIQHRVDPAKVAEPGVVHGGLVGVRTFR